jgi:hypothetical protein
MTNAIRTILDGDAVGGETQMRAIAMVADISAIVSLFAIVFLVAFFTLGGVFGPLNDIATVVQHVLLLPIAVFIYSRRDGGALNRIALLIGLAGMLAVIVLQALLVLGVLPFSQQIKLVIPAFLVVLVWFLLVERTGRSDDRLPKGLLLHALAGLAFGYPFWAFSLGRRLRS